MIELKNLYKSFDETLSVDNLSLKVDSGDILTLIGVSGCGKSTTLRMINRLIEPSSGEIIINGKSVKDFNIQELRRSIGYVIQNNGLFPHWNVKKNIATVPKLLKWSKGRIDKRVSELLEMFRLDKDFAQAYPHELSGGQQQRVGVARALAANPEILLMDEPFGALDPITKSEVQDELINIQSDLKKTIIMVTHDIDEAFKMADKIAIMHNGKILQLDTPHNIVIKPKDTHVRSILNLVDDNIKYLSFLKVKECMQNIRIVTEKQVSVKNEGKGNLWLVDANGLPKGCWCRCNKHFVEFDEKFALHVNDSLKQALNNMIDCKTTQIAVVDNNDRLIADISMQDICNI